MHRFSRDFIAYGVFFLIFTVLFSPVAYASQGFVGVVGLVVILGIFFVPCLWYRSTTVFADATRCVTHRAGFYPWIKERQIHYDDIEKLVLSGSTTTTNSGSSSAQFILKLIVRGNSKPIYIAHYGESEMRTEAPIIEAVAASNKLTLEKTDNYRATRDKYDGTREKRHGQSRYAMVGGVLGLLLAGYFALAHSGVPLPFQAAIEPLFKPTPKGNWGEGVEVIGLILGLGLGMIGVGAYFQTK